MISKATATAILVSAITLSACTTSRRAENVQAPSPGPAAPYTPHVVQEEAVTAPAPVRLIVPKGMLPNSAAGPKIAENVVLHDEREFVQEKSDKARRPVFTGFHHQVDPASKTIVTDRYFALAPGIDVPYDRDLSRSYVRYTATYDLRQDGANTIVTITPRSRQDWANDPVTAAMLPQASQNDWFVRSYVRRSVSYSKDYQLAGKPEEIFAGLQRVFSYRTGDRTSTGIYEGRFPVALRDANVDATLRVEIHPYRGASLVRLSATLKHLDATKPLFDAARAAQEIDALIRKAV